MNILKNFIVIEGLDGSGKSSQINFLKEKFQSMGKKVYLTHEPTDNKIGSLVRQVLQKKFSTSSKALALLYAADREDHLYNEEYGIVKYLNEGYIVISDRYFFSSFAYQGVDVDSEFVKYINNFPYPESVIYLDTPVSSCINRIEKRGEEKEIFDEEAYLTSVKNNFDKIFAALDDKITFTHLDGSLSIAQLSQELEKLFFN